MRQFKQEIAIKQSLLDRQTNRHVDIIHGKSVCVCVLGGVGVGEGGGAFAFIMT